MRRFTFSIGLGIVVAAVFACSDGSDSGGAGSSSTPDGGVAETGTGPDGSSAADSGGDGGDDGGAKSDAADAADGADANPNDGGPFGCMGLPLPTTAPATITLSGRTFDKLASGIGGIEVTAFTRAGDQLAQATSDASGIEGTFSLSITTGGVPVDGYLRARLTGRVDTYYFPASPFANDTQLLAVVSYTQGELDGIQQLAQATTSAGQGTANVSIMDCTRNRITGATASFNPAAATVRYDNSGQPSSTATSTSTDGVAWGFGLAAGTDTIGAQKTGITFRSTNAIVFANAVLQAQVAP